MINIEVRSGIYNPCFNAFMKRSRYRNCCPVNFKGKTKKECWMATSFSVFFFFLVNFEYKVNEFGRHEFCILWI